VDVRAARDVAVHEGVRRRPEAVPVVGAPSSTSDGPGVEERARSLVAALADARSRRPADDNDDVPDPIRGPEAAHEEAGELIVGTLLPLLARIAAIPQDDDTADQTARLQPRC
jgi:hypothetical protein